MFKFTQLKILHSDMKRKDEERAIFTFTYNKKHNGKIFSCIFLTDIIPYRLYLSAVGGSYLSFEFTLNENYEVETYLDNEKYRELVNFLGIKYDKDHIFKPSDFFEVLNKKIPTKFKERPSYNRVISLNTEKKLKILINRIFVDGDVAQVEMLLMKILKKQELLLVINMQNSQKNMELVHVGRKIIQKRI